MWTLGIPNALKMLILDLFIRKAWRWLCRAETCCLECNFKNKVVVVFDWDLYLVWIPFSFLFIGQTLWNILICTATLLHVILRSKTKFYFRVVSGFRREIKENRSLLDYCEASSGNSSPTFRDNISPETSVMNCHYSLNNGQDDRSSPQLLSYFFTEINNLN